MLDNKKAQVSDALTWVVATVIIIVILLINIYISSLFAGMKERGLQEYSDNQIVITKSLIGYLLTENEGERIFDMIKNETKINNENAKFATNIFLDLYDREYGRNEIWLGIVEFSYESSGLLYQRHYPTRNFANPEGSPLENILGKIKFDETTGIQSEGFSEEKIQNHKVIVVSIIS